MTLPTIAIIDGVRVIIWPKDHLPPHIHAKLAEHEAMIAIVTSQVLKGDLPAAKMRAVQAWLAANRPEVAYMWREIVDRKQKGRRID